MEAFTVECTDNDALGAERVQHHFGLSYFDALDNFRQVAALWPDSRFILAVGTNLRTRVLSDSDTDNVVRRYRGLDPVMPA